MKILQMKVIWVVQCILEEQYSVLYMSPLPEDGGSRTTIAGKVDCVVYLFGIVSDLDNFGGQCSHGFGAGFSGQYQGRGMDGNRGSLPTVLDSNDEGYGGGGADGLFDDMEATIPARRREGETGQGCIELSNNTSASTLGSLRDIEIGTVVQECTGSTKLGTYIRISTVVVVMLFVCVCAISTRHSGGVGNSRNGTK